MLRAIRRRGFTLVELLVVIAIIAVLIGFLVPAIQQVREAANVAQCGSQLRQIGVAFHSHHDDHRAFPTGGLWWYCSRTMSGSLPANYQNQTWGWAYQILPYVEQEDVWRHADDATAAGTVVPSYFCPSMRGPTAFNYWQSAPTGPRATIDYAGNGGTFGTFLSVTSSGNSLDGPLVPTSAYSGRVVTFRAITDGTSNTLLVGEKYMNAAQASGGTPDCNDDQGYVDGWDNDTICFAKGDNPSGPPQVPKRIAFTGSTCGFVFGSAHNSMQALMCDGSVRRISFGIDPNTWLAVCTARGSEPINLDD
jgi:prepilin-type N-terminal cleavage/methylation domain-containing protein